MRIRNNYVPILVAINVVMFIMQMVLGERFTQALLLDSGDVFTRPWILVSSMFLHGDPMHIFFNMYALFLFGSLIEQKIGSKRFLMLYFVSGILASIGFAGYHEAILGETAWAVGASGAVMGVLGMTIMLLPHLKVLLFFVIPMSMRTAGILFAAFEIAGIFGYGIPGIANEAHLVGLGIGLIYGYSLIQKRKTFTVKFVDRQHKAHKSKEDAIHLSEDEAMEYLKNGKI